VAGVSPPAIETAGLTKFYGAQRGIEELGLRVEHGEVFGFLGPNGAGKTTTIRLLLDLIRPTRGRAAVAGLDTRTQSLEVRRRTGYLPGELRLPARSTVAAFLSFLGNLRGGVKRSAVDELADRLELGLERRIGDLSKGNKQKVGVVAAFMHDPELLILDEPTDGLDPLRRMDVLELIRERAAAGRTVFLPSHDLAEVEHAASRVGIVRDGSLVHVAFYPSVRDDQALSDYAKDLPESVRALFAGGELDLTSPAGYLNSQIFALTAPLVLLIFAIGDRAGVVAGEEERGTLDLVLAHPVRRRDYVVQRFLALAALIAALGAALLACVTVGSWLVDLEIGFGRLFAASVSVALLALLYCAVALAAGSLVPGRVRAIAVAAALAVAAWIFDGLAQAVDVLDPWRRIEPYYQALGQNPLREGPPVGGWGLLLGATAVLVAVAAAGLERRDVRQ